jgi:hypothetical protein
MAAVDRNLSMVARILERTLNFLLNLAKVEAKSDILLQVYVNNTIKKTAVYK